MVAKRLSRLNILLVEDNVETLELLEHLLLPTGAALCRARDAETGWEIAQHEQPELIISDIQMQGQGGLWLLDQTRRAHSAWRSEVILLTGIADLDLVELYARGATALFCKPFSQDALTECLQRVAGGRATNWLQLRPSGHPSERELEVEPEHLQLGWGGVFVRGNVGDLIPGQQLQLGSVYEGTMLEITGVVRWVRRRPAMSLQVGFGVEIMRVEGPTANEAVQLIKKRADPVAFIPAGRDLPRRH